MTFSLFPTPILPHRPHHLSASQADRLARIAEEVATMGPSNRLVEEEALKNLLSPIGLCMKDIKAGFIYW